MRYGIILIAVLSVFLSGCGNDQYAIEKQYWQAQKQAGKVFNNPHASPPREVKMVIGVLRRFSQEHPKSQLALEAEFNIARLYIVKEDYADAKKQLQSIIAKYNKSAIICAEAVFFIGNSYELQDRWDLALAEYKKITQDYPVTPRGFSIPIYIAEHYKIKNQPEKMREALHEGVAYYLGLTNKYPNTPLAYQAHNLIAQCYLGLQDWQKVLDTLDTIINTYKGKVVLDEIIFNKGLIYLTQLKDRAMANQAFAKLAQEYPKSRFIPAVKKILEKSKE